MPIPVALYTKDGFAYNPEDISFGEAETKEIFINRNGNVNKVSLVKQSVTFKLKGAVDTDLSKLDLERQNNVLGLINGSVTGEDIDILGRTVPSALLTKVTPTAPINVNGITIFESIDLEYQSQVYS